MKTVPLYKRIADQIRNLIIENQYPSGKKLPSERQLSTMFGVSRAAIREALRSLAMIGALEVRYSEGIFIKNIHFIEIMNKVIELLDYAGKNEVETAKQAFDLMETLELEILSHVLEKSSEKDISSLKAILGKMETNLFNVTGYFKNYCEFHETLAVISNNKIYELLLDAMILSTSSIFKEMVSNLILLGHYQSYSYLYEPHLNIFKALDEKDLKKARKAMNYHFQIIESNLEKLHFIPIKSVVKNLNLEPEILSFGVIPFETIQLTAKKFTGIIRCIEESTGKKCNWFFPTSYMSLIEAQIQGFVHIGYYGTRSYLLAHELSKGMIEVFAQAIWGRGPYRKKNEWYHSYLIVRADSPYESINDLKGKILVLTDPLSTSGDLVPKIELGKKTGKKISEYFGNTFYAGRHDEAALCVLERRADAAVVADITMDWTVDTKRYAPGDFRIIWKSSRLPLNPFAWRKDLPLELKEDIKKAFTNVNKTDYGKEYLDAIRSDSIVMAKDSDFNTIRKKLNAIKKWA